MGMDMGRVTACGPFRERERERRRRRPKAQSVWFVSGDLESESSRVGQQASRHSLLRPPLEDRAPPSRTLEHDAVTDRHGQRVVAGREGLLAVAEQNLREFPRWMEKWDSRRPWRGEGWLLFPAIFPVLRASRGGVICPSMSDTRCRWTPGVAE
ncbi:hypothetical protein TEQG_04445 [Trichophyton equinum CBS 127.97]|uniref:Uncharacterized protein n=1 Tax=Trichophyton equinum (strain ATCC MYA-4606 / CBS 127.97) TaxID=559882 RepID=F2PTS1_TRIEC|nr:hypothetical protein TEQG_04445 [Trichophyton equinum CBS 127.97]